MRNFRPFLAIRPHHPHAGQVLVGMAGEFAEMSLNGLGPAVDQAAQRDHDDREAEQREEGQGRQAGADRQHGGCNQEGPDASIHQIHQRRTGHHPNRQKVVGRAGHDIPGRVAVVEFRRHPLEMLIEPVPQIGFDPSAAAVEQLAHAVAGHAAGQGHG